MRKPDPQVLRSADHALRVVLLVTARGKITVSEVAAELSVGVSTAHRLLSTCKHAGFVRQDRAGGPYTIGPAVHEIALATSAAVSLKDAAAPVLQDLRAEVGETTSMLILEGRTVRFVDSLEGNRHSVRVTPRVGVVLPAHCTSGGKAMLACLPEDELHRRLPGQRLEGVGERSIRTWPVLAAELERVRRRGWAVNLGEGDPGIGAVGAAIRSGTGEPRAAVVVAAPLSRLGTGPELAAVAPAVVEAAARVQRRLRGAPTD
jgi:IclR family acetate operon transcriptional repressor